MDIEEIHKLKKKLEIDIAKLIVDFETETRLLYVANIGINCYSVRPINGDCNRIVSVFCGVAVK